jgi:hypothetical protein
MGSAYYRHRRIGHGIAVWEYTSRARSGSREVSLRRFGSEVDGSFDAVNGVLSPSPPGPGTHLAESISLLRPGGRMSFAEPNMLNPQIYCERHFRRLFPQVSPDETAFVRTRLRRDLEDAGFTSVSIQPFDWLHPATPTALIPVVSGIGRAFEAIWPILEFSGSLRIWARRP